MSEPMFLTFHEVIERCRGEISEGTLQLAFDESWTFVPKNRQGRSLPARISKNRACIGKTTEIRRVVDWCTSIPLDTPLARLVPEPASVSAA